MTLRPLLTALILATSSLTSPAAWADNGAYLAARQANMANDFAASARLFEEALAADPTNPYMLESTVIAFAALGDFGSAVAYADRMVDAGLTSQISYLVRNVWDTKTGNWDRIRSDIEAGRQVGPLIDALSQAWAPVAQGQMTTALSAFDTVIAEAGLTSYGQLHKAYALASVGDYEGADALFVDGPNGALRYTSRSAVAHAQILSQMGDLDSANAVLDGVFGNSQNPVIGALRAQLAAGKALEFTFTPNAAAGIAEAYLAVAQAIEGEAQDEFTLLFARGAAHLDPTNTDAILLAATLLENLNQYDLASQAYRMVNMDGPVFQLAELGRSGALRKAGKFDAAIEALETLTTAYPDYARGFAALGDTLRDDERYADAIGAYDRALALYPDDDPIRWLVLYTRGIAHHQSDNWPEAEADFRAALELNPNQPGVLNYLGYSMVERDINLDEALDMIERAVAAQPQNGAIVDSLGWVLYQFGQYDDAVVHLENAASLLAVDPIINDHLGDAYWAVGRQTEAHFQWNRALSFDPTTRDATRIRRKLEIGLDAVLAEEGADPLSAQNGSH